MSTCYEYGRNAVKIDNGYKQQIACWNGFNKMKSGKSVLLERPKYNLKDNLAENTTIKNANLLSNKRFSNSNNRVKRVNFYTPNPVGRLLKTKETLRTKDISEEGIKINLTDATLDKLFKVEIPDIRDREWLLEKARRIAKGDTEQDIIDRPPLSRKQKTTYKMTNLGEKNLSFEEKIQQLSNVLKQNAINRQGNMKQVVLEISSMMTNASQLANATRFELDVIKKTLEKLYVPKDWRQQFKNRIIDGDEYKQDMGAINIYLMSNIPPPLSASNPIYAYDGRGKKYIPTSINKLFNMKGDNRYLDLETRTIETKENLIKKGLWSSLEQRKEDDELEQLEREIREDEAGLI